MRRALPLSTPLQSQKNLTLPYRPDAQRVPQQVLGILRGLALEAMGTDVATDMPLMSAGLDSLGAVELKNGVSARFGVSLPATVAFDYPTLEVVLRA